MLDITKDDYRKSEMSKSRCVKIAIVVTAFYSCIKVVTLLIILNT